VPEATQSGIRYLVTVPKAQYAANGEVSIAFQVVGEGPDLLWTPGFISHLDVFWTDPDIARFVRLLSSFSRLIVYDKRGTGLSDPTSRPPTLEERVSDLEAVLDAAGSEHSAILGFSEGAAAGALFAARYPARVSALVAYGAIVLGVVDGAHPWGVPQDVIDRLFAACDAWGEGRSMEVFAPSLAPGGLHQRVWGALERSCASPSMARSLVASWRETDLSEILPAVRTPTVVLHRRGDAFPLAAGRYFAEHVAGARLVELEGTDHLPWLGDSEAVVGEIEQAVTGERRGLDPASALTTVLFTDIVESTQRAAALGDVRWRAVLDRHEQLVRAEVTVRGGRLVDSTGDGFLIAFDEVAAAIDCAHAVIAAMRELSLEIRAGVHTGECQMRGEDLAGVTIHIGARVCALAGPGEVLVTKSAADLAAGAEFPFVSRGVRGLKGVPGEWELLTAHARDGDAVAASGQPARDWRTGRDRAFLSAARHLPAPLRLGARLTRRRRATEAT
jgi:class 3 adenylate cyclase